MACILCCQAVVVISNVDDTRCQLYDIKDLTTVMSYGFAHATTVSKYQCDFDCGCCLNAYTRSSYAQFEHFSFHESKRASSKCAHGGGSETKNPFHHRNEAIEEVERLQKTQEMHGSLKEHTQHVSPK